MSWGDFNDRQSGQTVFLNLSHLNAYNQETLHKSSLLTGFGSALIIFSLNSNSNIFDFWKKWSNFLNESNKNYVRKCLDSWL